MNTWYAAKNANDSQGLVIEENTGRNVAVTYDAKDARLVSAAPDLLDVCKSSQPVIYKAILDLEKIGMVYLPGKLQDELRKIDAAIAKAEGR